MGPCLIGLCLTMVAGADVAPGMGLSERSRADPPPLATRQAILDAWQPSVVIRIPGEVVLGQRASDWQLLTPATIVDQGGEVLALSAHEPLYEGDRLSAGVLRNGSGDVLLLTILGVAATGSSGLGGGPGGGASRDRPVPPGGIVLIGCLGSCSVECGIGTYACCHDDAGCAVCGCLESNGGHSVTCDAGGVGAISCSATVAAPK